MNLQGLTDEEILETIQEAFAEDARLAMLYIDLEVVDGAITIGGRVSSEEELQIIDEVMDDNLQVEDYRNKVWVDETLGVDDADDDATDVKDLDFDDDDIDDQEYEEEDDEQYK